MSKDFIRIANEQDMQLINTYFEQALAHYEAAGELMAMQDIKYFLHNVRQFQFVVLKEKATEIT